MKSFFRIFYMLTISLCFCNCSNHDTKSNEVVAARQPDFIDNGKAIDSLKKVCDASGSVPLFVLNLLSSNLQYQLLMLDSADAIGIRIASVPLDRSKMSGTL